VTEQKCEDCANFWQHVPSGNECVDRCPAGKSWNRYRGNNLGECIDIYEVFDHTAKTSVVLQDNLRSKSLGGSLTKPLVCSRGAEAIRTPYSEQTLKTEGLQYVEFFSGQDGSYKSFDFVRLFLSADNYRKLRDIIDTQDNTSRQCQKNKRACWDDELSYRKVIDSFVIIEGF